MKTEKLKSLIPIEELENEAQQQIYKNLELPFLEKLVIMPDCHAGYTLPIGGVALLNGIISPTYVGYDISCGMCCIITDIDINDILKTKKDREKIFDKIYKTIPVGFNMRESNFYDIPDFESASNDKDLNKKVNQKLRPQLGSLGGGNHFIEIGKNKYGKLAITLHSGSRNPGHSVADYYMKKSKIEDTDLPNGFFHVNSEWGEMYYHDMTYMMDYALYNRQYMMAEILDILGIYHPSLIDHNMINETHNHAIKKVELIDNSTCNVKVLHRKGATASEKGQIGIIPGNMRDGVWVTKGLGNEDYLCSSSHGAGRKGSRTWAKKSINIDRFKNTMSGIIAKIDKDTLDESPDAYKNINDVIVAQEGIVIEVIDHIEPLINIKG